MKKSMNRLVLHAALVVFTSCAGTEGRTSVKAVKQGTRFEGIGKVRLHEGQPCTPQIMFDFNVGLGSTIWLAAGVDETKTLTDAARRGRRVRVAGKWRHGQKESCSFVSVTNVGG
ncbi:MAG: hypothetical protein ABJB69_08180 [Spartobacteria bacterium]